MKHAKEEIDRLSDEYQAGAKDFKEYVTRLISMDSDEIAELFYGATRVEWMDVDNPDIAWEVLMDFSSTMIMDTFDDYDMKQEAKRIAVEKFLTPGSVVYLKGDSHKFPIMVLDWRDYCVLDCHKPTATVRLDKVIISYVDLISMTFVDSAVEDISNFSEVDFAHEDNRELTMNFMAAIRRAGRLYFINEEDKEIDFWADNTKVKRSGRYKWNECNLDDDD